MEIAPRIHWIDRVNANVYACIDDEGVTLIDTGLPGIDRVDLIFNYLERLHLYPADIRQVVLTHADRDHAGNAARLVAETGATVWAAPETVPFLTAGRLPARRRTWIQRSLTRFGGYPAVDAGQIQPLTSRGERLPVLGGLEIIATPGHCAGHLSFFNPQTGVLFAGDALNTRRGKLQCTPEFIADDLLLAYRSAVDLLQLSPAVFACGHGRPMANHALDTLIRLQEQWLEKINSRENKRV